MKKLVVSLLLITGTAFGNLWVYNDSNYVLTANIISGSGDNLGSMTVQPQSRMQWLDNFLGGTVYSYTPYTVVFTCPNGNAYGVSTYVPSGATVTAQGSNGQHYCRPPPKNEPYLNQER